MSQTTDKPAHHRTLIPRTVTVLAVAILVALGAAVAILWNQRPPHPTDDTLTQLTGACCTPPGAPGQGVGTDRDQMPAAMIWLFPLGDATSVDGNRVSLTYDLFAWTQGDQGAPTETRLTDTDLRVGDTVTHGPATLEVVAIHDAFLDRNDAVDLRVTFDLDRIDEVP